MVGPQATAGPLDIGGTKEGTFTYPAWVCFEHAQRPDAEFERSYGRDAREDGSWTAPEGKSVVFRCLVIIHEGKLSTGDIGVAYKRYANDK